MYIFEFAQQNIQKIQPFLQQKRIRKNTREEAFARIYRGIDGKWHLLGAFETPPRFPLNKVIYELTEESYVDFLNTFKPNLTPEKLYHDKDLIIPLVNKIEIEVAEIRKQLIREAKKRQDKAKSQPLPQPDPETEAALLALIRSRACKKKNQEAKGEAIRQELLESKDFAKILSELSEEDIARIASLPEELESSPELWQVCRTIGVQDSLWMSQSVITNSLLPEACTGSSTHLEAINTLASQMGGAAVGIVTGVAMGAVCGRYAAQRYKEEATKQFIIDHKRLPSTAEKKGIERDAKHLGYKIYGAMTGWSVSASVMQMVLIGLQVTNHFHPAGWVSNIIVSTAAGVGQAVGVCLAHRDAEKEKFKAQNTSETWDQYKSRTGYNWTMAKLAVSSFVAGFAWNMIGQYIPAPISDVVKKVVAPLAATLVSAAVSSVVAGFAAFTSYFVGLKIGTKPKPHPPEPKKSGWFSFFRPKKSKVDPPHPPSQNAPAPIPAV